MTVSQMSTDVFFSCLRKVLHQLSEPEGYERLLDEARQDTPIIEGICSQIAMILHVRKEDSSKVLELAHRDLEVFLALREMERREHASQARRFN